jgi:8-oxo-dGTP diphosphatase
VVNPQEDIDEAANRVLKKYTGLEDVFLEQVRTFGKAQRHPLGRVVTTAYYSLMQLDSYKGSQQTDEAPVEWFSVEDLPGLAFDHKEILESCMRKLRQNLREHPIGFELLPQQFTLTQLQNLYEVVLGIKLDKRNFRRKLNNLNLLVSTGQVQSDVSHRPANLYRFDFDAYKKRLESGFNFEI